MAYAPAAPSTASEDLGKLLLRLMLGLLILFHGVAKLRYGPAFVVGVVNQAGLPTAFAYLVYVGEVVAPLLLVIGLFTRAAALVVTINMIFALALVHTSQFFTISPTGGWALELQGAYLVASIVVALLGAGRFSVGGLTGRFN